jgi:hypothetical protein
MQTKADAALTQTIANAYGYRNPSVTIEGSRVFAGSDYVGHIVSGKYRDGRDRLILDAAGRKPETFFLDGLNPIVKTTALRAYPGWTVAEHHDGSYTVSSETGGWCSVETFSDAIYFAKHGEPRI